MDPNEMQLAISYAELAQSLAFRDFMKFQALECERLELEALNAPASDFSVCRSAIIAWQQRRLVIRTLEQTVMESANAIKSTELENSDARIDADRNSRAGW